MRNWLFLAKWKTTTTKKKMQISFCRTDKSQKDCFNTWQLLKRNTNVFTAWTLCAQKNRIKNHKPMHDSNAYNLKGNVKISGLISHHMQNKTAEVKKISNVSKECLCDHLISALPLPSSCFCYSNQPHHPHLFSCVFPPPWLLDVLHLCPGTNGFLFTVSFSVTCWACLICLCFGFL